MAGAKEIKSKIGSINNTRKITSAMEKVAVSKMRRAQERVAHSRPYAEGMRKVIGNIANGNIEYRHPLFNGTSGKKCRLHCDIDRPWPLRRLKYQ